jgi:hypothetical protein
VKHVFSAILTLVLLLTSCAVQTKEITESTEKDDQVLEEIPYDQYNSYESILKEYQRFAVYAIEDQEQVLKGEPWYACGWLGGLIVQYNSGRMLMKDDFGYAIQDLNGNGSPELILHINYTVLAIFSMVNDKPMLLDDFGPRHYCAIDSSGMIYTHTSGGATTWSYAIYKLSEDDSQLLLVEEYGENGNFSGEGYYQKKDGEYTELDKKGLDDSLKTLFYDFSISPTEMTKNSSLSFVALF